MESVTEPNELTKLRAALTGWGIDLRKRRCGRLDAMRAAGVRYGAVG